MLLSDRQIRTLSLDAKWYGINGFKGLPMIAPYSEACQEGVVSYGETAGGYDLRLGYTVKVFKNTWNRTVSPKRFKTDPEYDRKVFDTISDLKDGEVVEVPGHSYILGYSLERIAVPRNLKGRCVGKSTYARCGIIINTTPLEPEWVGHLTIEIANTSPCAVELFVGEGIAQLEFEMFSQPPQRSYADKAGKYQDQHAEPVAARIKE